MPTPSRLSPEMEALLISACLLGVNCKYSGGSNALPEELLEALRKKYRLLPVCPEVAGGLPVPRLPAERRGERVVNRSGEDVTARYRSGARCALAIAEKQGCRTALLKERSPSCGSGEIYDGSFTAALVPGWGTAAEELRCAGIKVLGESRISELI